MTTLRLQNTIERLLLCGAFVIAACYTLLAAFQYAIPYQRFTSYILWAALALVVAAFVYLIVSLVASSASRSRVISFFKRFFSFEQAVLLFLLLWFVLSCLVNGIEIDFPTVYFYLEDWFLFGTVICFLVLFPLTNIVGVERAKKAISLIIHLVAVSYSAFTVFCLWRVFHLHFLALPSGEAVGMTADFQLMLGRHYNLSGMIAATIFCLCVYMVFTQKLWLKIVYSFFGIAQLIVVYLSNSRTVFVGVLVFVAFLVFVLAWHFLRDKKIPVRLLLSLALAVLVSALFWLGRDAMFALFERITHFSEKIAASNAGNISSFVKSYQPSNLAFSIANDQLQTNNHQLITTNYSLLASGQAVQYQPVLLAAEEGAVRQLSDLSNRVNIWTSALRVMVSSPRAFFFGVTPAGVTEALQDLGGYWGEAAHAHNSVLQVGAGIGVPAMASYIVFLLSIAAKCLRLVFAGSECFKKQRFIIPASILCFTAINMAEAYLFAYFSVIACFFYLFCGRVSAVDEKRYFTKQKKLRLWLIRLLICILVIFAAFFSGRYFSGMISRDESNLLMGTNHGLYNYHLVQRGFDARMKRDGEGVKVIMNSHDDSGWCVLLFDDGRAREILSAPLGDVYTLSFDAKANIANADIRVAFRQGDGKEVQIDFGTAKVSFADQWQTFSLTGTLRGVSATSQGLYFNLKNNPSGTEISIRNLKLEKIDVPHDPSNLLYGTNLGKTNFSLMDKGFNAILEEDGIGVKVTSSTRDDSGWLVLSFNDGNSCKVLSGPEGASYTLSFEAKSNIANAEIRASHRQGNGQENQIDFGTAKIASADAWETFTLTGTLKGISATTQGVYLNLKNDNNPAGTDISIRNLKLSKTDP